MRAAHSFHRFLVWIFAFALAANCAATTIPDGVVDPTFGANGLVYLGWDADLNVTAYDVAIAVLAPTDGSVILVGNGTDAGASYGSYSAICIAKLTRAGTFDTSFGDAATPGQTKIHGGGISTQIAGTSAALQSDGKIVIAGNVYFPGTGKQMAAVWRLNADGSSDTNFGFDGATLVDRNIGNQFDSASAVAIVKGVQGTPYAALEGRIVVAGSIDFSPTIVIASSWMFQLDTSGIPVPNDPVTGYLGSNSFYWTGIDCDDGRHDQTFSAIHVSVQPDTGTMTYYLAGNCPPRPNTGRIPQPYIAAVDPKLNLIPSFGNSDNGISQVSYIDSLHDYRNATITSLDVDPGGRRIVYVGNYFGNGDSRVLTGALNAADGHFDTAWSGNGAAILSARGSNSQAYGILINPTRGSYVTNASEIVAGQDACLPPYVCALPQGTFFSATQLSEGTIISYCGATGECALAFPGETTQGAYAIAYTQGFKVLLAGYVKFGARSDFAVMRLQGEEIFFNGFGHPSQDFR